MVSRDFSYRRIQRILILVILFLSLLVMALVVRNYVMIPFLGPGKLLLESSLNLPTETLLALGGLAQEDNFFSIDPRELEERYEASPYVRQAKVTKAFPNTMRISLYGRTPLGLVIPKGEGYIRPQVFDEYGEIFKALESSPYKNLPILSGIELPQGVQSLPVRLKPLWECLKQIQLDAPPLYERISELKVVQEERGLEEVFLFLNGYTLPVRVGFHLDDTLMKRILLVLDSLEKAGQIKDYKYADFRGNQVVLGKKEEA